MADKSTPGTRKRVRDLIAEKIDEKMRSERMDDHFDGRDYADAVMELFPDVRELGEHHGAGLIVPVPSHGPGGMVATHTRLMLSTAPAPIASEPRRVATGEDHMRRATARETGRCGQELPATIPATTPVTCTLPAGHDGWHRSDGGAEWGQRHVAANMPAADRIRLDPDNPRAYVDADGRRVIDADTVTALRERDRYREHAVTLNTICWRIASALGDVPAGAEQIAGDPVELVERLIADRNQALERVRQLLGPSLGSPADRAQELPALVFNAISRALQDVWPISAPLPVVRERCAAAVLEALNGPAGSGEGERTQEAL